LAASAAHADPADSGFIGSPLPANTSPVSSTAGADPALEIERAVRADIDRARDKLELDRRLERIAPTQP